MSNIINFPGIENEQKKIQEQAKAAVNIIMSAMMESKILIYFLFPLLT